MIQVVIILVLLMGAGGFGAYSWVQKLQAENQILQVNQDKLQGALDDQALVVQMQEQPGLVVKIINRASKNEMRCYEIASGSPLTEEELAATKKSQTNGECPGSANPNYKGDS